MDEKYQNKQKNKKKNKGQKNTNSAQEGIFNFDNEIVIGVTKVPEKKKKRNKERIRKTENVENDITYVKNKANEKERKSKKEKIKQSKSIKEEINKSKKGQDILKRGLETEKTQDKKRQNSKKALKKYETMQVEVIREENEQNQIKKNRKTRNKKNNIENRQIINRKDIQNRQEIENKISRKNRIVKTVAKWTVLVIALFVSIIFFMMCPLFDLVEIQIVNNDKVSSETIISLSGIKIGENIYKNSTKQIQKNIKQNAYIESVKIDRKLPNKILIKIKERKATFILEYANSYAYINNQGYILEITQEKLNLPIIAGYVTNAEEIKEGSRLVYEDLEKLETVLKIIESANSNGISELITKIDIQDKQNYILVLENEKKTVYLGDASNLSNRMLYLKAVLEEEKNIEGEIFINGDLHKEVVYFRKKE